MGRLAGVWGAIRVGTEEPAASPDISPLTAALAGVVVVGAPAGFEMPSTRSVPGRFAAASGLAAALRHAPSDAVGLAWLDTRSSDGDAIAAVAELWRRTGPCDAAVVAGPVTDAIKQVRDGRIVRNVDRDDLCVPVLPIVLRIATARDRLLAALDADHEPIAALAAARLGVRVVPRDRVLPGAVDTRPGG
ncbi:MAG: hypothetical protein KY460_07330 [Actinobacteria bacterium]|nr:hypothetical protein [Actinomycetota bacterium]